MELEVIYHGYLMGRLKEFEQRIGFEYSPDFIEAGIELSPLKLQVQRGALFHDSVAFANLFGLFYDALPDQWGLQVMRKRFALEGIQRVTPLMQLAYLGSRALGALEFRPVLLDEVSETVANITSVRNNVHALMREHPQASIHRAFFQSAASAGGMQPKIQVGMCTDSDRVIVGGGHAYPEGYEAWMIKFSKGEHDVAAVEKVYMDMAALCGIDVPETKLLESDRGERYFAIKRFDRFAGKKVHMHSLSGVAHLPFKDQHEYDKVFDVTLALTKNLQAMKQMFRRMVFNVLANNHDDHTKNFSFILAEENSWRLSPAYDLLYTETDMGGHWMFVNGYADAINREDLMAIADRHAIGVGTIIDEVVAGVSKFSELARKHNVNLGIRNHIFAVIKTNIKNLDQPRTRTDLRFI